MPTAMFRTLQATSRHTYGQVTATRSVVWRSFPVLMSAGRCRAATPVSLAVDEINCEGNAKIFWLGAIRVFRVQVRYATGSGSLYRVAVLLTVSGFDAGRYSKRLRATTLDTSHNYAICEI